MLKRRVFGEPIYSWLVLATIIAIRTMPFWPR